MMMNLVLPGDCVERCRIVIMSTHRTTLTRNFVWGPARPSSGKWRSEWERERERERRYGSWMPQKLIISPLPLTLAKFASFVEKPPGAMTIRSSSLVLLHNRPSTFQYDLWLVNDDWRLSVAFRCRHRSKTIYKNKIIYMYITPPPPFLGESGHGVNFQTYLFFSFYWHQTNFCSLFTSWKIFDKR